MFHHVVVMRIEGADEAFHRRVEEYAARVRAELPYVLDYVYRPNLADRSGGYDWAILSSFASSEDHDRYQASDLHQEMKAFMSNRIAALIACDIDNG